MLKEQDIKQYLNEKILHLRRIHLLSALYSRINSLMLLVQSQLLFYMQYFAMNFNDIGSAIIGLNNTTGKLENEAFRCFME